MFHYFLVVLVLCICIGFYFYIIQSMWYDSSQKILNIAQVRLKSPKFTGLPTPVFLWKKEFSNEELCWRTIFWQPLLFKPILFCEHVPLSLNTLWKYNFELLYSVLLHGCNTRVLNISLFLGPCSIFS